MDKIRDLRDKFFQIDDEYLNGYAKLCGINATGVYLSMCRHANKQQTCFPSKKLIAEELSISPRSVYSAIEKLKEWNIIRVEEQGRKDDGSFTVKLYTLLNKTEWKPKPPQANNYRRQMVPSAPNDNSRRHVVPNKETHIELNTNCDEQKLLAAVSVKKEKQPNIDQPMNREQFIQWCAKSTQRHVQIIGEWVEIWEKIVFSKKSEWQVYLSRNLRAARQLSVFSAKKIDEALDEISKDLKEKKMNYTPKIETVLKKITV